MINAASSGSLSGAAAAQAGLVQSASAASLQGLAQGAGEPPPCRTIFVRNILPDVDDGELQALFEVRQMGTWVLLTSARAVVARDRLPPAYQWLNTERSSSA